MKRAKLIHLDDDDFKTLSVYCMNARMTLKHYIERLCSETAKEIRDKIK